MLNASAHGWVDKFFVEQNNLFDKPYYDAVFFYEKIRKTGFIYGNSTTIDSLPDEKTMFWKTEELCKVALLNVLYQTYFFSTNNYNIAHFKQKAVLFYEQMAPKGFSFLKNIILNSDSEKLETIINQRVQTNKDFISKNFSHIITNALLFVDVLAFHHYLQKEKISDNYVKKMEQTIMSVVSLSLQSKTQKSKHEDLLLKYFEASVRYTTFSKVKINAIDDLPISYFTDDLEHFYLLDLAVMAIYSDDKIENEEHYFLLQLANVMQVSELFVIKSIAQTDDFIKKNKHTIQYFNYSNPVKHFYDQTSRSVLHLIKKNKKRLVKEVVESKELMHLLAQSAQRNLSKEEKKKVKKQLLDICKTVPSLAIFLLPGGGLLLPLLLKFIPQLLPSAFNENLND